MDIQRNDNGVPVMESEHEHGTVVVGNYVDGKLVQMDEVCACVVDSMHVHGGIKEGQYFTILPMQMEVH